MTQKTKRVTHTPGPWVIKLRQGNGKVCIKCRGSNLPRLEIVQPLKPMLGMEHCRLIAEMPKGDSNEANARLIASAPELLILLSEYADGIADLRDCSCIREDGQYSLCFVHRVLAAIAKAEGK